VREASFHRKWSFAHKNVLRDRCCAAIGRDPAEIVRATGGAVSVWSQQPGMLDPVDADVEER
jgi:hypothetical protein